MRTETHMLLIPLPDGFTVRSRLHIDGMRASVPVAGEGCFGPIRLELDIKFSLGKEEG